MLTASVLRGDVAWPDKVEDDGQRETAVGNRHQSPEARKAEKSSDDAVTDGDPGASVLRGDVAWSTDVEEDGRWKNAAGNSSHLQRRETREKSKS